MTKRAVFRFSRRCQLDHSGNQDLFRDWTQRAPDVSACFGPFIAPSSWGWSDLAIAIDAD